MKYVLVLGDGMADEPIESLQGMTPLEYAKTPVMDELAGRGEIGIVHTIPDGMKPGSDTANLSVLGYDPKRFYSGRSPLEALSIGVPMKDTDISYRVNIVTLTDDEPFEAKTIVDHSSGEIFKKVIKKDNITVKAEKLKNKDISSMLTISEEARRMQDMMKMYAARGMDMGDFGSEGETLILNAGHPLVKYVTEHEDGENTRLICEQLYDLAKIQQAPLSADDMATFIARSNDILMLLADEK